MRFKVVMNSIQGHYAIPINYNHPLSSAVYKMLHESSPEYSTWLHSNGFINRLGKPLKLFCVSRIFTGKVKLIDNLLHGTGSINFFVSSPFETDFPQHFINGLLSADIVKIGNKSGGSNFEISSVTQEKSPILSNIEKYELLSPASVSTVTSENDKKKIYYFRADDDGVEEALCQNLLRKYETLNRKPYSGYLNINLDKEYIAHHRKKLSKLVKIREGLANETRIKAFYCPLKIEAETDMQQLAWDCGIGERNSMGFGCLGIQE